jgi:hypothetical protein
MPFAILNSMTAINSLVCRTLVMTLLIVQFCCGGLQHGPGMHASLDATVSTQAHTHVLLVLLWCELPFHTTSTRYLSL